MESGERVRKGHHCLAGAALLPTRCKDLAGIRAALDTVTQPANQMPRTPLATKRGQLCCHKIAVGLLGGLLWMVSSQHTSSLGSKIPFCDVLSTHSTVGCRSGWPNQ